MCSMKNIKAILLMFIIILMAGCGWDDTATEPTNEQSDNNNIEEFDEDAITIVRGQDPRNLPVEEMHWYQNFSEVAPEIDIQWIELAAAAVGERVNLMLGSNELPDAFLGTLNTNQVMNHKEQLLQIEEYINPETMPYFSEVLEKRPEYRAQITAPDGHIYGLPYIEEMFGLITNQGVLSIYKPWLDELGLPIPTTIDEYRDALKQFVENDMNGNGTADEIGLSIANKDSESGIGSWRNNIDFGQFFGLWGQADRGDSMGLDENGKIFNTAATEAYKTGIQYLHEMYEDGLIDEEFLVMDTPALQAKLRNEEPIVGSVLTFSILDIGGTQLAEDYVAIPYLKGPNGEFGTRENLSEMHNPVAFVLSKEAKDPQEILEWADKMYDPEWSVQTNWGVEGYVYEKNEDGVMVFGELKDGLDTFNDMRARHTIQGNSPVAILTDYYDTVVEYPQDAQDIMDDMEEIGFLDKYFDDEYIPHTLFYEEEEAARMAILAPEIYGLIDSYRKKWISEGGIEDEWDTYLEELDDAGWDEYVGYVQEAYDHYLSNQ